MPLLLYSMGYTFCFSLLTFKNVVMFVNAGLVKQNEQRCEQEIEDIKRGVKCGNITPDTSLIRFSDEALDEQKHSIRIADEKVALAVQAYDLVCGSSMKLV